MTDTIEALFEQAVEHHNRGRLADAVALYDAIIALNPNTALVYSNRGAALCALKRFDEALASFDRAIALKPDYAGAYNNQANALADLKRFGEAVASYDRAIAIRPDYAEAHYNRANALKAANRQSEAIQGYNRAIEIDPGYAEAHANRGNALKDLNRWDEALASYEKAMALKPDMAFTLGALLYAKTRICDFAGLESRIAELERGVREGKTVCTPFQMLALSDSPELQRRAAEIYVDAQKFGAAVLPMSSKYPRHDKIRLGYFSADYHDHATMHLMAGLFERHDKTKFELYAFSFGPDRNDAMRARAARAFDRFVDVRERTDADIALLSRNLEIDIAVDLKGFTQGDRMGIFAHRAAPIQVNYLGYPGTMGADFIDYILADAILIPAENAQYYREKIVCLPNTYQVNDRNRAISDRAFSRAELGLPDDSFVFCCFNNNYKIMPDIFESWMRILERCEGSVLWLLEDNAKAADNLRNAAKARGIDGRRLIFAPRMTMGDHLARMRHADLFLDTFPYTAHTTASEALWAGLPVLTRAGQSFASRVAASVVHAAGLRDLVTTTVEDYEALALRLAHEPEALAALRQKLAADRLIAPLFDTELFARNIETAFIAMYERHQVGLAPADIRV